MSIEDGGRPIGLAQRLDDGLLRLERWRSGPRATRPVTVGASLVVLLLAVMVGTGALLWSDRSSAVPVEELIPMADPDAARSQTESATPASGPAASSAVVDAMDAMEGGPDGDGEPAVTDASTEGSIEPTDPDLVIHVVGAVTRPGLVTVPPGARISDAVRAAGGPAPQADAERLNLAAPLSDGMQIRVPFVDEEPQPLIIVPSSPPVDPDGSDTDGGVAGPVDLNRAGSPQLQSLPGIGPAIAAAIMAWREENGGFATTEDLLQVPGIGPAKFAALRDLVTI